MRARLAGLAVALTALGILLPASAWAAPRFVPGEVLVRYGPGTSGSDRAAVRDDVDAGLERRLPISRVELLELDADDSVKGAVRELEGLPDVSYAEPNFLYRPTAIPNDTLFGQQWGMNNTGQSVGGVTGTPDADIDAAEAWDTQTGPGSIVVGVVDTGVALPHPDLNDNLWTNLADPLGGGDNDGNSLVDDINGWDFKDNDNDPTDQNGHGTHVAGIIGAEGNNALGVAGVNWDVQLMLLRVCGGIDGLCPSSGIASAFTYAAQKGADVVNASIAGPGFSQAMQDAVTAAPGTLFVFAAGNDSNNNDGIGYFPCGIAGTNAICVAASGQTDALASFSNFGANSVDLAAPGVRVDSTYPYESVSTDTFGAAALGGLWLTGGAPNTWARSTEAPYPGGNLTDSPGGNYANNANNFARWGPIDLTGKAGCQIRFGADVAALSGDTLFVEASTTAGGGGPFDQALGQLSGFTKGDFTLPIPTVSATTYIRFRFSSTPAGTDNGVHIDYVELDCFDPDRFVLLNGTSMASPQVAGAGAILQAELPAAAPSELRTLLLDGADLKPSLTGLVATGGRLNLDRSVQGANGADIHRPNTAIVIGPPVSSLGTTAGFGFVADEAATFSCSLDGGAFVSCASPQGYSGLGPGSHLFQVFATDLSGNADASPASYAFVVQSPPTTAQPVPTTTTTCKKPKKKKKKRKKKCVKA